MMGPDMVTIIISVIIKPVLLLMIIAVLYLLLRKSSAALRHFCLLMGVIALLVLPVTAFLIPDMAWQFPFSRLLFDYLPFSWKEYLLKTAYVQIEPVGWQMTLAIYLLVSTSLIFYLVIGYLQLWFIYRQSSPVADEDSLEIIAELKQLLGVRRKVNLVISKKIESPCAWGFWQPKILLPASAAEWSHEQKISVLMHEMGHIHRQDTLSLLLVKITCAIFWFLPPVWWLAKKISTTAEIACDDLIYQLRDKHIQYAEHLLQFADHRNTSSVAMPMSGHSEIYQRIMSVLDTKKPRDNVKPEKIQYVLLMGILFLASVASISSVHWPQMESNISMVNLRWGKPESTTIYPTHESIADAENTLIKVSWLENQEKPSLDNTQMPAVHYQLPDLKKIYKVDFSKTDLFAEEQALTNKKLPASYQLVIAPQPIYPKAAIQKAQSGYVNVSFTLDAQGIPNNILIEESNPEGLFDQAITEALKKSQYRWQSQPDNQARIRQRFSFQLEKPRTR